MPERGPSTSLYAKPQRRLPCIRPLVKNTRSKWWSGWGHPCSNRKAATTRIVIKQRRISLARRIQRMSSSFETVPLLLRRKTAKGHVVLVGLQNAVSLTSTRRHNSDAAKELAEEHDIEI